MNILIYGPDKPKISFTQSPDGLVSFRIENERTVQFESGQEDITWQDIYPFGLPPRRQNAELILLFEQFSKMLATLTGTDAERKFFLDYARECITASEGMGVNVWEHPALIPQAWVNWIHYDPKDPQRAERAQKEPFRVDFMLKDGDISPHFVIFEIDGQSHFEDIIAYTRHLQRDRWLRKQGWPVFRISNYEVEHYENFNDFYYEITGKFLSIPF
jgi:hypothetical protein